LHEACGHFLSWPCVLRHGFVDQPNLFLTQQVTQDQTGGFVVPLDAPEREMGMVHGLEHARLVGAGRKPCGLGVTIEWV